MFWVVSSACPKRTGLHIENFNYVGLFGIEVSSCIYIACTIFHVNPFPPLLLLEIWIKLTVLIFRACWYSEMIQWVLKEVHQKPAIVLPCIFKANLTLLKPLEKQNNAKHFWKKPNQILGCKIVHKYDTNMTQHYETVLSYLFKCIIQLYC